MSRLIRNPGPVIFAALTFLVSAIATSRADPVLDLATEYYDRHYLSRPYYQPFGGLSSDGRTLAVESELPSMGRRGVVWDESTGLLNPIGIDPASPLIALHGVSGDGRFVVGRTTRDAGLNHEGAIWDRAGNMTRMGVLPNQLGGFGASSSANAASRDGSIVVGGSAYMASVQQATIWQRDSGLHRIDLGETGLPDWAHTEAFGVSGNGKVVVGTVGWRRAFIWNASDNTTRFLGSSSGTGSLVIAATDVSEDGSTVVGYGRFDGAPHEEPFIWTKADGLRSLYDPETGIGWQGRALAVSGDGRVVVGSYETTRGRFSSNDRAFIWTAYDGIQDLRGKVESLGITTSGWRELHTAWGVSADGLRIAANGLPNRPTQGQSTALITLGEPTTGANLCNLDAQDCIPITRLATGDIMFPGARNEFDRFGTFDLPTMNKAGDVAFEANTKNGWGIFGPDAEGELMLRALGYTTAPGIPGREFRWPGLSPRAVSNLSDPVMNESGDLVFYGAAGIPRDSSPLIEGLWRSRRGETSPELLVQTGAAPENEPDIPFGTIYPWYQIDEQARPAFHTHTGRFLPPATDSTVYAPDPNDPSQNLILARRGQTAPGLPPDVIFKGAYLHNLNARGQSAFWGFLEGPNVDATNDTAIWATDAQGDVALVLREGDPAPGFPAGTVFTRQSSIGEHLSLNAQGVLAFFAETHDPSIPGSLEGGFWIWTPDGQLRSILRQNLPDAKGIEFAFVGEPIMNARGDIAFRGFRRMNGRLSAYENWKRNADGSLLRLLSPGDAGPGLPPGSGLTNLRAAGFDWRVTSSYGDPVLMDNGASLLEFVTSRYPDRVGRRALYWVSSAGHPTLVLHSGHQLEMSANEIKTVKTFYLSGGFRSTLGRKSANARGDVAATVVFEDNSEAVIIFHVPEPSARHVLPAGVLLLLWIALARRVARQRT